MRLTAGCTVSTAPLRIWSRYSVTPSSVCFLISISFVFSREANSPCIYANIVAGQVGVDQHWVVQHHDLPDLVMAHLIFIPVLQQIGFVVNREPFLASQVAVNVCHARGVDELRPMHLSKRPFHVAHDRLHIVCAHARQCFVKALEARELVVQNRDGVSADLRKVVCEVGLCLLRAHGNEVANGSAVTIQLKICQGTRQGRVVNGAVHLRGQAVRRSGERGGNNRKNLYSSRPGPLFFPDDADPHRRRHA